MHTYSFVLYDLLENRAITVTVMHITAIIHGMMGFFLSEDSSDSMTYYYNT